MKTDFIPLFALETEYICLSWLEFLKEKDCNTVVEWIKRGRSMAGELFHLYVI